MAFNAKTQVGIVFKGEDGVSAPAKKAGASVTGLSQKVTQSASRMDNALQAAAGGLALFVAGFKGLKGAFGLAQQAGEFQQELAAVGAITNASARELQKYKVAAINAGLATQFSPKESALGLRSLGQAGLKGKAAMDALVPSLDLAAASLGKLSPQASTGTVNAALKTFGLRAAQSKKAVDSLIFSTNSFNISVEQLPIGIGNVSRGAIALKQNMNDTMIALGLVKNVLPEISSSATLTSSAMLRIADPKIQKKLNKLGVTFQDQKGNFLPVIDIFLNLDKVLRTKFPKATDASGKAVELLGKRGMSPFMVITKQLRKGVEALPKGFNKGRVAFQVMRLQFQAAQGDMKAVEKMARMGLPKAFIEASQKVARSGASRMFVKTLLGTFAGQITLLKGSFSTLLVAIGEPLTAIFKPFVSAAYQAFSFLSKLILNIDPTFKRLFAGFFVASSAAMMLVGALAAIKAAVVVIGPFISIALLAPFLKVIAVVGALMAAITSLVALWKMDFKGVRTVITSFFSGFWEGFKQMVLPSIKMLGIEFKKLWTELGPIFNSFKAILVDLGIISFGTTTQMSSGWKTFGYIVGTVLGAIVKSIAFFIRGLVTIARLIGAISKSYMDFATKGKLSFTLPKVAGIDSVGDFGPSPLKGAKGAAITKAVIPKTRTAPQATPPSVLQVRQQKGQSSGQKGTSKQPINVQVKGNVEIEGKAIGKFVLEQSNEDKNRAGIRSRGR